MTLTKPKKKKLINRAKFIKIANQVKESFKEEFEYLQKKKIENGNIISSNAHTLS